MKHIPTAKIDNLFHDSFKKLYFSITSPLNDEIDAYITNSYRIFISFHNNIETTLTKEENNVSINR